MILLPNDAPENWPLEPEIDSLFTALDLMSVITRSSKDSRTWTDKLVCDRVTDPDNVKYHNGCWQYLYFSQVIKFEIENEIMRLWPGKVCTKDSEHIALIYMCTRKLTHFGGPLGDTEKTAIAHHGG